MAMQAMKGEVVLSARGLSRSFFRKGRDEARFFEALRPCDVDLRSGELTAVMGRSGSGKSTLLNLLAGLLEPTQGTVVFGADDLYKLDDARRSRLRNESFGIIPQGQTAIQSLTVLENVVLPHALYHACAIEDRAYEMLAALGIEKLAESYPRELSGGELRRMAIARALVCEPAVVFADEPTSDLDDENTELVVSLLRGEAQRGAAVVVVTHEQSVRAAADRLFRMNAGQLEDAAAETES